MTAQTIRAGDPHPYPPPPPGGRRTSPESAALLALAPGQIVIWLGLPKPDSTRRNLYHLARRRGLQVRFWTAEPTAQDREAFGDGLVLCAQRLPEILAAPAPGSDEEIPLDALGARIRNALAGDR